MKTTVILDELNLSEVRPDPISRSYAQSRRDEALKLLSDSEVIWSGRALPTEECDPKSIFECDGLSFHVCRNSGSIFASPIPDQNSLDRLAASGDAARQRINYFAQRFSKKQRDAIHTPLLRWISDSIAESGVDQLKSVAMTGNDHTGMANAVLEHFASSTLAVVERVIGQPIQSVECFSSSNCPEGMFDLVVDNASLERVCDPNARIELWWRLLAPGGYLAFTTNTASGIEYRLFGASAPSFVALDRLTLYTIPALNEVLTARGFEVKEMSTPGRVDVQLIEGAITDYEGPDMLFWQYLFRHGNEQMRSDLQNFLQRHRLSSYARVFARKPL